MRVRGLIQLQSLVSTGIVRQVHELASIRSVGLLPEKKRTVLLHPYSHLETHLSQQVDQARFKLFQPDIEAIEQAEKLFTPTPKHQIMYFSSAVRRDHIPELTQPEVCFMGRSNVGKSSLIRSLFALVPDLDVRVSKTPGHTKKLNFFTVGKAFTLVDMPGYGYKAPEDFVEMVEPYLQERKKTFLLVDGGAGLQKFDLVAVEMCEEFGIPYVLVVTKTDRNRQGTLLKLLLQLHDFIKDKTSTCFPQPFLVSSVDFSGIHLLRCFIAHVTGNLHLSPKDT